MQAQAIMKQEKALAILKSGKNIFLTGSAGTGKTYVLNQYINYLKARKVPVAITASTGIAATHMNGQTIHSWAGIGVKEHLTTGDLRNMSQKKYLKKNLENAEVLIIDEISMLHKRQLTMVNRVLQHFKNNYQPFGGVQLVLAGDFFQLPPVSKNEEINRDKFAFMSESWVDAGLTICYLTDQFRQSDNELNIILNEIRSGDVSNQSKAILYEAQHNKLGPSPTKLYSHNIDVDNINNEHLLELNSDLFTFKAKKKGNENLVKLLEKSVLAPSDLQLKIGAKVMFVKNNYEKGYVNGTQGVVVDFLEGEEKEELTPLVKTVAGRVIAVEPEKWSFDNEKGASMASLTQIPLRLGWAITIHKSQGMTLDAAEIDLSKTFEKGQGYVALSRLKDLEGMLLLGFNEIALQVDSLALKADKRFQELSVEADQKLSITDLEKTFKKFILKCGGNINEAAIRLNENRLIRKQQKKDGKDTYQLTKELIDKEFSLDKIASQRALTKGTVIGHLNVLKKKYPDININQYKPDQKTIVKVKYAVESLEKENPASLKDKKGNYKLQSLHQFLNGKISYDDLKLALVYI